MDIYGISNEEYIHLFGGPEPILVSSGNTNQYTFDQKISDKIGSIFKLKKEMAYVYLKEFVQYVRIRCDLITMNHKKLSKGKLDYCFRWLGMVEEINLIKAKHLIYSREEHIELYTIIKATKQLLQM